MKAILLAAGNGTRLRPITNSIPKCLVPIQGRPLLEIWIDSLLTQGITEILINTHHLSNQVKEFIDSRNYGRKIILSHEERLLGTAGTLLANRKFIDGHTFFLAHADNLTKFSLDEFRVKHLIRPKYTEMTMMLFESDDPSSCGIVELNAEDVVVGFEEKPTTPKSKLSNSAIYVFESSVVEKFNGSNALDISLDIIPNMLGKIFTYKNNIYHRDIGTPESLRKANLEWK
jgi:mannose-1-phosphate guanylyltransferase